MYRVDAWLLILNSTIIFIVYTGYVFLLCIGDTIVKEAHWQPKKDQINKSWIIAFPSNASESKKTNDQSDKGVRESILLVNPSSSVVVKHQIIDNFLSPLLTKAKVLIESFLGSIQQNIVNITGLLLVV